MDDKKFWQIEARKAALLADASPKRLWWLSFCDPSRPKGQHFLGVVFVEGSNAYQAMMKAHELGCNPGGEVLAEPFFDDEIKPPERFLHRLLSDADLDELKVLAAAERAKNGGSA